MVWQYFSDSDSETWNGTSPLRFTYGLPDCDCLRVSHSPLPSLHPVSGIVFHCLATTHSHISMADITLPRPTMDWSASDHAHALCDFQQLREMCFTVNQTADALQHNYIMLWLGSEGLRLLNSWSLMADQLHDPKNIWDRLALLEPSQNFQIHHLEMQHLCQKQGESVEDFYFRIKMQAWKCKYTSEDDTQERILKQLIAGMTIPKVQCELLSKDGTFTLAQALDIAKAHEASIKHMRQIQDLTPSPATSTIDAVSNNRCHKQCGNCGSIHAPCKCPAYGTTCSRYKKKNHWRQVCHLGSSSTASTGGGEAAHAKTSTKPTKRRGWWPRTSPPGNSHHHRWQRWWSCQQTGMSWILIHQEEQRWQLWQTLRQSGHPVQAPGVPESKGRHRSTRKHPPAPYIPPKIPPKNWTTTDIQQRELRRKDKPYCRRTMAPL